MTYQPVSVPDEGPLSFSLWLPRSAPIEGGTRWRVEATSAGVDELAHGTEECVRAFLSDVAFPTPLPADLAVRGWTVSRYACPFFSDFPTGEAWEDHVPLTWAVQVDVGGTIPEPPSWGPFGTQGHDETSFEVDTWGAERGEDRVVVVGAPGPDGRTEGLDQLAGVVSVDVLEEWGMVALDLGTRDLPQKMGVVETVLAECASHGLRTYWGDAK